MTPDLINSIDERIDYLRAAIKWDLETYSFETYTDVPDAAHPDYYLGLIQGREQEIEFLESLKGKND